MSKMLSVDEIRGVIAQVFCPGYKFLYFPDKSYLQVELSADGEKWTARKWPISQFMTHSEIVQTALKAVLTAAEHELREHFTFHGRALFGPHFDVYKLIDLVDAGSQDLRTPAVSTPAASAPVVSNVERPAAAPAAAPSPTRLAPAVQVANDFDLGGES